MKRGKKYKEAAAKVDRSVLYDADEALQIVKDAASAKFDETVELHIRTGCDGRHAEQQIRGAVVLPNGTGRSVRILVFAKGNKLDEAQEAGADYVGGEELIPRIQNDGWFDFDVVIATPDMMGVVGPLGKILGPRGLMPSPRAGTVTMDVAKAVHEYKMGKVEFRNDSAGAVQAICGKLSFEADKLQENIQAFIDLILSLKPAAAKGQYLKGIAISATMSPGIRVTLQ